jgi:sugar phosphate isomerase/epimerase
MGPDSTMSKPKILLKMYIHRRHFLKTASLLGASLAGGAFINANILNFPGSFKPAVGVCTGLGNADMLAGMGYSFIEESVRGFLVPDRPEGDFIPRLEEARGLRIPVSACNLFIPGEMKSVGPDAVHDKILEFSATAFRRAQLAGVRIIVFGSGGSRRIPDGFSRDDAYRQFVSLGRKLAPLASKNNVVIALEPLNRKECNFINSLADGAEIVNAVSHRNYRLLADIYHMMVDGEDSRNIIRYGDLIRHVHIAEEQGRAAPGTHGEDFGDYFSAFALIKYQGGISIESRWDDMAAQAPAALAVIKEQAGRVKGI